VRARDLFDRSLRAHLLAADERWGAAAGGWTAALLVAVVAAFAVLLGISGLGLPRTLAAEAFVLGYAGTLLALVRAPAALRKRPALRPVLEDAHFGLLLGAVACTGGLQSPLLLALLTVTPARVLSGGWSRRTRAHVLVVCAAALAMAVVPRAWFGPPLPPRTFAGIAALALASGVLLHSHYIGFLSRTVEESVWDAVRAREQVAAQALTRTRELEHLGARLSHELKNPLAAIKALAQLAGRAAGDPDAREALETIVSEAERMRHVVDEYLSFSRPLEKLRLEPVSLGELAQEIVAVLAGRADEARVALAAGGDAVVVADPRRLKEALLNVVANALEATPPGGRVAAVVSADGPLARVTVTDTGAGMPPEVLARIGTPFFTTRESGTGLGVLLARTVFKQHGGALEYESTPGAGTVAVASLAITGPERSDSHAEAAVRG
jgi:signal transduction histidine kinase